MKRFPAFDPPEYLSWQPEPALVREFGEVWHRDADRRSIVESLSPDERLALYAGLVRTRLHDVALKRWVKQGVISKAWLGTGEEATTVGPVHALDRAVDVVAPMIRNAGACCEMGMPVADMLRGYLGTFDSPSRGRDGHVGSFAHRVLQPISNIGNIPAVAGGIALSFRLRNEQLNDDFLKQAKARGMVELKGHRAVGGMRASIYNAMPIEGVKALVEFMREFQAKHG